MASFNHLWEVCDRLEKTLNQGRVGAVSFSSLEKNIDGIERWEKIVANKFNDLKLLNSKAILLNATVLKDQIPVADDQNIEEVKNRLCHVTEAHGRWTNALKIKAISKAVYSIHVNNDEEKKALLNELLFKLSDLDHILNDLNICEEEKSNELSMITEHWKQIVSKYMEKKLLAKENAQSTRINKEINNDANSHLHQLINKMEIFKGIQGRLLGSCLSYDWMKDPAKLDKYLSSARREPYKPTDFLQ